ncbi:MAG TPA: ATP phosphoribosyltransferase regulatory subunit [Rubrobacter sp.]|nr:ATP phosphoribosyltransferase regulatory subunit [Rubrobacter sp.]
MDREPPRKFATTPGTRDVLPPESTRLLEVQGLIRDRFKLFGFREVLTPALEYSEVIEEHGLRDVSYKLFDQDNQMLLLRPEMTTPIARVISQRLAGSPPPHKLSYVLPAYRRASVGRGQSAELYQAGVEVVGSASPKEDASTIALLVDVLQSLGLSAPSDFAIVLGQSAFYAGYLRHVAPDAAKAVTGALAAKDLVAVDDLAGELPADAAAGVRGIPRIVGPAADESLLEEAGRFVVGKQAREALENLREILRHLEAHGVLGAVILDLGLSGRHEYYTGAVYEAYAAGLGFTVANGGRYDNLLRRFGKELPATGFAIYLERLLSVLPEKDPQLLLVLVGGDVSGIAAAARLRKLGVPVLHLSEDLPPKAAVEYARSVEAAWISYPAAGGVKVATADPAGEFVFMSVESVARMMLP